MKVMEFDENSNFSGGVKQRKIEENRITEFQFQATFGNTYVGTSTLKVNDA